MFFGHFHHHHLKKYHLYNYRERDWGNMGQCLFFTRRCSLDNGDDNDNMFRKVGDDAYDDNDDDDMFRRVGAQL